MSVAANRYARALIEALYPEKAEAGAEQIQAFAAVLKDHPEGRILLQNPAMAGDRRQRFMTEISSALGLDRRVSNFVNILIDRNRLPLLDEIIAEYQRLLDQRLGIVRARVTTAQTLEAGQHQELAAKLAEVTGKQVRMEVAVDPTLIGGVIAQVGSTIYDGSVRQQLQAFKSRLVEE
jgi:F-type H+-transporting ATPase subunit delta